LSKSTDSILDFWIGRMTIVVVLQQNYEKL
jgi:hypothetical protein